jgi:hypothetical protein
MAGWFAVRRQYPRETTMPPRVMRPPMVGVPCFAWCSGTYWLMVCLLFTLLSKFKIGNIDTNPITNEIQNAWTSGATSRTLLKSIS